MLVFLKPRLFHGALIVSVLFSCFFVQPVRADESSSEDTVRDLIGKANQLYAAKDYRNCLIPLNRAINETQYDPQLRVKFANALYGTSALSFESLGQYTEAIKMWEALAHTDPNLVRPSLEGQAREYEKAGQLTESLNLLDRLVAMDPSNRPCQDLKATFLQRHPELLQNQKKGPRTSTGAPQQARFVELADSYLSQNQNDLAITNYSEALSANANSVVFRPSDYGALYVKRGDAYAKAGRFGEAVLDYSKALSSSQKADASIYIKRANAYLGAGDLPRAEADAAHALRLEPSNADGYGTLGYIYLRCHRYPDAIKECNQAIALKQNAYEPYMTAGMAFQAMGDGKNALLRYQAALNLHKSADLYVRQGDLLMTLKRTKEAVGSYSNAVALSRNNTAIADKLVAAQKVLLGSSSSDREVTSLQQAFHEDGLQSSSPGEGNPTNVDALKGQARRLAESRRYEEAVKDYTAALSVNPRDAEAFSERSNMYLRLGQSDNALSDAMKTLQLDDKNASALYVVACVHEQKHSYKAAVDAAQRAMALCPSISPDCVRLVARCQFAQNDMPACLQTLDVYLKSNDRDGEAFLLRGEANNRLQKYDLAIKDFDAAEALGASRPTLKLARADSYKKLGQYNSAIADLQSYIQSHHSDVDALISLYQVQRVNNDHNAAIATLTEAFALQPTKAVILRLRAQEYEATNNPQAAAKDREQANKMEAAPTAAAAK